MAKVTRQAIAVLLAGCITVSAQAAELNWQLAKDESGVKVYLAKVEGSKYKAYKGVALMNTDLARLRALQEDVTGSCAWMHECREQKRVEQNGESGVVYSRFNTPWPVTPRDTYTQIVTEQGADGSLLRRLTGKPDFKPAESGFVRVSKLEGFWQFTPKGNGQVEVVYQVHTEPGGSVPSWLANSFVLDAPFNTLLELKKLAEQK
ncbi:START domain-containing protein [Atopomonas sediminilitoris]|uniref:START domain-containing protein n=1 Tax=Atopomonas sediminilitoris TaxID=2919919 RepID=UPI001F4D43B6|nr:START domain-containing protein [Atopomonas sediminilitoris]MCJ8167804.1 START domain-containing protein [Atopomonas sediminilitoris]